MSNRPSRPRTRHAADGPCSVCGRTGQQLTPFGALRPALAAEVAAKVHGELPEGARACARCLNTARVESVVSRLEAERGELSSVEADIARRAVEHTSAVEEMTRNLETRATTGQRLADAVARVGGSWPFVVAFVVLLVAWVTVNTFVLSRGAFDPFPYILLNLLLSCVAALQAPIILMAQNRTAHRDRAMADHDYRVNLKAELEIALLHEKVDHLLHSQWEHMVEIQQAQMELLEQLDRDQTEPE